MKPVELEITERKIVVDIIHAPAVNGAIFMLRRRFRMIFSWLRGCRPLTVNGLLSTHKSTNFALVLITQLYLEYPDKDDKVP